MSNQELQEEFYQIIKTHGLETIAESNNLVSLHHDFGGPSMHHHNTPVKRPMVLSRDDEESDDDLHSPPSKKRKARQRGGIGDKNKGLRHFSMRVCEKVREKGRTTYNEVADELVMELVNTPENLAAMNADPPEASYDEKNIRRRVYDALNVLMAMDILAKEKKEIIWRGLPQNVSQDMEELATQKASSLERIETKKRNIEELNQQLKGYVALMERNRRLVESDPSYTMDNDNKINLPFIIVNTKKETQIVCEMTESRQEIFFNFENPFEIHDDNEILGRMIQSHALTVAPSRGGTSARGRTNGSRTL